MPDPHQEELIEARINIARLESEVAHLTRSMGEVKESQADMAAKLDAVLLTLSEARGGWKTLMLVGGAASTIGALVTWAITQFSKG